MRMFSINQADLHVFFWCLSKFPPPTNIYKQWHHCGLNYKSTQQAKINSYDVFLFAKNPWRFTSKKAILQVTWRLGRPETSWHGPMDWRELWNHEHVLVASPWAFSFTKWGVHGIYIYISNEHGGLESQFLISNLLRSGCLCQEIWFDKADLKDLYLSFQVDTFDVFVSKNLEFKTVIVRIQTEVNHQRKSPYFC